MELLSEVSNTQLLFTVAAVAVVLICAALVFVFGFHSAEQPQFDKLPLVVDDRKSSNKKRKTKEKKSSPNRSASDESKAKSESKKTPTKEKKEEKIKEVEKPKPKEKQEPKPLKKDLVGETKKGKKSKHVAEAEKPADFDEGVWEEVPKKVKSDKKKVKNADEKEKKKESPSKKEKKVVKDADIEAAHPQEYPIEETIKVVSAVGPELDEESARALQAQVEEFQRVLKEAELREQAALGGARDEDMLPEEEDIPEVKDLRSNKKQENKEKQIKKKANEKKDSVDVLDDQEKTEEKPNVPVFDELGDTWTDAKISKKSKKKARKDQ
ncbi:hypothetical protein ACJJTC_016062 [Scirpophaga incertulas]